jgi:hypothetical protein
VHLSIPKTDLEVLYDLIFFVYVYRLKFNFFSFKFEADLRFFLKLIFQPLLLDC